MEGASTTTIDLILEAEAVVEAAQVVEVMLATSGLITLAPAGVVVPGQLQSEFGSYALVEVCYFIVVERTKIHKNGVS